MLYTIEGGDHVWFGDNIEGEDPRDILWRFLSDYVVSGVSEDR